MKNIEKLKKRYAGIARESETEYIYAAALGVIEAIVDDDIYSPNKKIKRIQEVFKLIDAL